MGSLKKTKMESRPIEHVMDLFGHLQNWRTVLNGSDSDTRYLTKTEMTQNDFDSEQKSLTLALIIIMVLIPLLILLMFFLLCCKSCWRVYRRKSDRRKLRIAAGSDMESDTESWNTDFNDNDDH